jgi:hypothetical protein
MTKVYINGIVDAVTLEGSPPGIWGGAPSYPDQGLPGVPPGIWPSPGHPAHPIAPGRPPGIWGGPPHYPDQGLPGQPPGIWPSPGVPTHPIYVPINPPPVDGVAPEHPIYIPVYPSHPIAGLGGLVVDIKRAINFWTGNLPGNSDAHPSPV